MSSLQEQKKIKLMKLLAFIEDKKEIEIRKLVAHLFYEEMMSKKTAKEYIENLLILEKIEAFDKDDETFIRMKKIKD